MAAVDKLSEYKGLGQMHIEDYDDDDDTPEFVTTPPDLTIEENSLAHFECTLNPINDDSMRIEWFHNGKPLLTGSRVKTVNDFGFVILEIIGVDSRDAGLYTCKASNDYGQAVVKCRLTVVPKEEPQEVSDSIQQLEAYLYRQEEPVEEVEKPKPAPTFTVELEDALDVPEGGSVRFDCQVEPTDDSSLRIDWFFNGRPFATGSRVRSVNDFGFISLEMDYVFARDSGEYVCRATNKSGTASTKAKLICKKKQGIILDSQLPRGMNGDKLRALDEYEPVPERVEKEKPTVAPKFLREIESVVVDELKTVHFATRVEPKDDSKLKVEWFRDGKPLPTGSRYKSSFEFGFVSLDISQFYEEDSGEYVCRATNDLGVAETKAIAQCKTERRRGRKTVRR